MIMRRASSFTIPTHPADAELPERPSLDGYVVEEVARSDVAVLVDKYRDAGCGRAGWSER